MSRADSADPADPTIAALVAAAEPDEPRPLATLIERLAAEGRLTGAREGGRAIGPGGLGRVAVRGVAFDSRVVRGEMPRSA